MKRTQCGQLIACFAIAVIAATTTNYTIQASEIEGFTEPFRQIDVAAAEAGILDKILVKEGDEIQKGQLLGELNYEVLSASLKIADTSRKATGKASSAKAELRLKTERYEKLKQLLERQHATQEEVDRTAVEKEVSEAQLLVVEEERTIRNLEYDRIQQQIELRKLRSPINGSVTRQHKDTGEFVSPNDPVVVTVVQLDPLVAVFSVPGKVLDHIKPNQELSVVVGDKKTKVVGSVQYVSPVINAESGTAQVKVQLPNPNRELRSGSRCFLVLPGITLDEPEQAVENTPERATPLKSKNAGRLQSTKR